MTQFTKIYFVPEMFFERNEVSFFGLLNRRSRRNVIDLYLFIDRMRKHFCIQTKITFTLAV